MKSKYASIMDTHRNHGNWMRTTKRQLTAAVEEFKKTGVY